MGSKKREWKRPLSQDGMYNYGVFYSPLTLCGYLYCITWSEELMLAKEPLKQGKSWISKYFNDSTARSGLISKSSLWYVLWFRGSWLARWIWLCTGFFNLNILIAQYNFATSICCKVFGFVFFSGFLELFYFRPMYDEGPSKLMREFEQLEMDDLVDHFFSSQKWGCAIGAEKVPTIYKTDSVSRWCAFYRPSQWNVPINRTSLVRHWKSTTYLANAQQKCTL
jgi:hypothetical protein